MQQPARPISARLSIPLWSRRTPSGLPAQTTISGPHSDRTDNRPLWFVNLFRNGAQGRDRTTDTAIFSRMLYQLSYLGISRKPMARERRFIVRADGCVHPASPSASLGAAPRVRLFVWREFPPPISHLTMRYDLPRKRER